MTELKNNNKPAMVSFADTFNPDTAPQALVIPTATVVDGQNSNSSGRWDTVWAEAQPVLTTTNHDEVKTTSGAKKEGDETVVMDLEGGTTATTSASATATTTPTGVAASPEHYIQRCNFMVLVLGWSLAASAVASTLMLEVAATTVFLCAVGFHWVAETFGGGGIATNTETKQQKSSSSCSCSCCNPIACFVGPLFRGLTTLFLYIDTFLLVWSVFVTELLAAVACLLCSIFGGILEGAYWHQTVRRLCHLSRWAFREFHTQTPLPRILPFGVVSKKPEEEPAQEVSAIQTSSSSNSSTTNTGSDAQQNSKKGGAHGSKGGEDDTIVVDSADMEAVDLYDHKAESSKGRKTSK